MNAQIRQVYGLFIVLFALLVGFTSYWSVFDSEGLADNPDNRLALIEAQTIPRGRIFASDGQTRARGEPRRAARPDAHLRAPVPASAAASPIRSATRSSRTARPRWSSRETTS